MPEKVSLVLVGINGLIATMLAAMGSHAFPMTADDAHLFAQASDFHFYHTLALIATAPLAKWGQPGFAKTTMLLFMLGIIAFSGSLYWRGVMGPGSLGPLHWITPVGGMLLMAGWLSLTIGALRVTKKRA